MQATEPDNDRQIGVDKKTDRDTDCIQHRSVVRSYVKEILRGADLDLIKKQLKEGQNPALLKTYKRIIEEELMVNNGNSGGPQISRDRLEVYKKEIEALEILRDKINIVIKENLIPGSATEDDKTGI